MADSKERIVIDSTQAVQAINNLSVSITKYNQNLLTLAATQNRVTNNTANNYYNNQVNGYSRVTTEINRNTQAIQRLHTQTQQLYKIVVFAAGYRFFFGLISAVQEATRTVKDLSIAISEIRTISQDANIATENWSKSLEDLSVSYGLDILDGAESAYQTLSNQIRGLRGETLSLIKVQQFLSQENRLATITQSTLAEATSTTTSVLNGYQLGVEETARVNAVLFKTVELGRLRLSEMADTLGRVNNISKQLGISFEEQQASLAVLTRQGIKFAEAVTLLRNLQLKLIKPSERLQEIFESWGVDSGEAAIQTFGFAEVLKRLATEAQNAGDFTAETGEIFNRLRAQVGFGGLASSFNDLDDAIAQMKDSGGSSIKAFREVFDSEGKQVERQINRVKILLINQFGKSIQTSFLNLAKQFGGADKALKAFLDTSELAIKTYITYRVALFATTTAVNLHSASLIRMNASLAAQNTQLITNAQLQQQIAASNLRIANGISLAIAALAFLYFQEKQNLKEIQIGYKQVEDQARNTQQQLNDLSFSEYSDKLNKTFNDQKDILQEGSRNILKYLADTKVSLNKLQEQYQKSFDAINKTIDIDPVKQEIKVNQDVLSDIDVGLDLQDLKDRNRDQQFELDLKVLVDDNSVTAAQKFLQLQEQLKIAEEERNKLFQTGNFGFANNQYQNQIKALENAITQLFSKDATLQTQAIEFEQDRLTQVQLRLEAERQGFAEKEQFLEREKKKEEQRKKDLQDLVDVVTYLDGLTIKASITDIDDVIDEIQRFGDFANLNPLDTLKFVRQGEDLKREIEQNKVIEDRKKTVEEVEELTKRQRDLLNENLEKEKQLKSSKAQNLLETIKESKAELQALQKSLSEFQVSTKSLNTQVFSEDEKLLSDTQKRVKDIVDQIENIDISKNFSIEQLDGLRSELKNIFQNAGNINFSNLEQPNTIVDSFGLGTTLPENLKFDELSEAYRGIVSNIEKAKQNQFELQEILEKNRQDIDASNKFQLDFQNQFKDFNEVISNQSFQEITNQQEINNLLDERIKKLQAIRQLGVAGSISPNAPIPVNNAFGGTVGSDRIPAVLSPGETVMTAAATRQFAPLLSALNNSAPSSSSIQFGDINVNLPAGSSGEQADEFINQVRRRSRTGRWV